MGRGALRWFGASVLSFAIVAAGVGPGLAVGVLPGSNGEDTVTVSPTAQSLDSQLDDSLEGRLLQLDQAYVAARTAGDSPLTIENIGRLRAAAADAARGVANAPAGATFNSTWTGLGPNPIVQVARSDNSFIAVSGRVGALAIRKSGQMILGAAQGGIWLYNSTAGTWSPTTDTQTSLAIGALAVASDDMTIYAGTGEGALSGDSYYGNGILKSTDGGLTWSAPIRVDQSPGETPAFTPQVYAASDGTVGVSYYDLENATGAHPGLTDAFIVHCHAATADCANAANWRLVFATPSISL